MLYGFAVCNIWLQIVPILTESPRVSGALHNDVYIIVTLLVHVGLVNLI